MKTIEAIFWGVLAFALALIAEVVFSMFTADSSFSQSDFGPRQIMILVAIEEISKLLILWRASRNGMLQPWTILVFGSTFGLIEIFLLGQRNDFGSGQNFLAALPILLVHVGATAVYGYCLNRRQWAWILAGLAVGAVFHAAYNFQETSGLTDPSSRWILAASLPIAAIALVFAQKPGLRDNIA